MHVTEHFYEWDGFWFVMLTPLCASLIQFNDLSFFRAHQCSSLYRAAPFDRITLLKCAIVTQKSQYFHHFIIYRLFLTQATDTVY